METRPGYQPVDTDLFRQFRKYSVAIGIGLIVLGFIAILLAAFTTYISVLALGVFLAVRGVLDIWHSLANRHEEGFWLRLIAGVLSLLFGVIINFNPGITAQMLTFFIGTFLIAIGLFRTIGAPLIRSPQWGWVLLSGLISLFLGFYIFANGPETAIWLIGLMVGIEILTAGITMLLLPFVAKQFKRRRAEYITAA